MKPKSTIKTLAIIIALILLVSISVVMCATKMTTAYATPQELAALHARAEQGDFRAQDRLGTYYWLGPGGRTDYQKAHFWYAKAAEQGHRDAQIHLGMNYYLGWGVERDRVQAYKWLTLAKTASNEQMPKNSQDALARAEAKMTPEQLEQAKAMVKDWKPKRH